MRLHVGVVGAKQLLGAVYRQLLQPVGEFLPAVIALSGVTFGIFVGKHAAERGTHAFAGIIFARNQFQALALAFRLVIHQRRNNFIIHT